LVLGVESIRKKKKKKKEMSAAGGEIRSRLYVGGLPHDARNEELKALFAKYGSVRAVDLKVLISFHFFTLNFSSYFFIY